MKRKSITDPRAKSICKALLGIILDRKPTEFEEQRVVSMRSLKGVYPLPGYASLSCRMSLDGKTLLLGVVTPKQIEEQHGRWAACLLVDLANLWFEPWRKRVPIAESPDSFFNFDRDDAQAVLDEDFGENDISLQLSCLEDLLVANGHIPSRVDVLAAKADVLNGVRDRSGEQRNTLRAMLGEIESRRKSDLVEVMQALGRNSQTFNVAHQELMMYMPELISWRKSHGAMANRLDAMGQQVNRLEGLLQALLVAVRASQPQVPQTLPEPTLPIILAPWTPTPGPMCAGGTGWRTGLEND